MNQRPRRFPGRKREETKTGVGSSVQRSEPPLRGYRRYVHHPCQSWTFRLGVELQGSRGLSNSGINPDARSIQVLAFMV